MEKVMEKVTEVLDSINTACCSSPTDDNGNEIEDLGPSTTHHPFATLPVKYLSNIISYLNYSDLLQCRLLNKHFHKTISHSTHFVSSTILELCMKPMNDIWIQLDSTIPWRAARVTYLDYMNYIAAPDYQEVVSISEEPDGAQATAANVKTTPQTFSPPTKFLSGLQQLEFQNCYITWGTLKRLVSKIPRLDTLALVRCKFVGKVEDSSTGIKGLNEFEEFRVGRSFSRMTSMRINEHHDLKALNILLEKFVGYESHCLEKLEVIFDPEFSVEDHPSCGIEYEKRSGGSPTTTPTGPQMADMEYFCLLLTSLLKGNGRTLKKLRIDIKHQILLNRLIPGVFGKMGKSWKRLNLEELILSPPGCGITPISPIDVSKGCDEAARILCDFLSSQQGLGAVALPHFRSLEDASLKSRLGSSLPASITYLCIPNQEYLPPNFLEKFPSLKKLHIGGCPGEGGVPLPFQSSMFNPPLGPSCPHTHPQNPTITGFLSKVQVGLGLRPSSVLELPSKDLAQASWRKYKELGIGSTIINGIELSKTIEKFEALTKLEIMSQLPVIQDEDVQSIIRVMAGSLQYLNVAACDFLTDYGVTGILRNSCEMMVRLDNYREDSGELLLSRGKPLSMIKGLRTLILMGRSHITDVGLHFGMRFPELTTACLPYNAKVTEWGVTKFALNNPSLQVFVMSGVNQRSREGFLQLQKTHPRIKKNKCTFLNYSEEQFKRPDLPNTLVKFDILENAISNPMSISSTLNFWLFGKGREIEGGNGGSKDSSGTSTINQSQDTNTELIPTISMFIPSTKEPVPPVPQTKKSQGQDQKLMEKVEKKENNNA